MSAGFARRSDTICSSGPLSGASSATATAGCCLSGTSKVGGRSRVARSILESHPRRPRVARLVRRAVDVELLGLLGVFGGYPNFHGVYSNGDEVAWVTTVFQARVADGLPAPGDEETSDVRWATFDEAFALEITSSTRHILTCAREGRAFDP